MPRKRKETVSSKDGLIKNFKLKFNHVYNIDDNTTLVIRRVFLDFEEIYSCDKTIYDSIGGYRLFANEPFTLKEICGSIGVDYKTVVKP